jgi:hypothetical protein
MGGGQAAEGTLDHTAAEFAKHGVTGISEALAGLAELVGGGRVMAFPGGFDVVAYARAKPHFEAAWVATKAVGKDFEQFFVILIRALGAGIKPYAIAD